MAAAHASIAMGRTGADLSIDTADAVTVRDELSVIPTVVALARRARRIVVANLVIAGTVIVTLVAWDLVGDLPHLRVVFLVERGAELVELATHALRGTLGRCRAGRLRIELLRAIAARRAFALALLFVGLDVIGDYLTEINITSPTCIREIDNAFDTRIGERLMDAIAAKLQA